jgi:hypothetical protein
VTHTKPAAACSCHTTLQGKRDDGRPSNAAPSPNSAKTALEALLTCEGLERVSQPHRVFVVPGAVSLQEQTCRSLQTAA